MVFRLVIHYILLDYSEQSIFTAIQLYSGLITNVFFNMMQELVSPPESRSTLYTSVFNKTEKAVICQLVN